MPYDQALADRLYAFLHDVPGLTQKNMFGGIGWFLNGNMCVGVYKNWLIARVGEIAAPSLLSETVLPMDITGKPMKGWLKIHPSEIEDQERLSEYCQLAIEFVQKMPAK